MEVIPLIVGNYQYLLIGYGYYSAFRSTTNSILTGKWIYDKTCQTYRLVFPKKEKWNLVENCRVIDPKEIDTFVMKETPENFTLLEKI